MQTSSFSSNQVSGLRGRNPIVFAVLTVVAMLLAVLVPTQGAQAASVTASSVSSVSPATGLTSGSTLVTLTGTNLTGTTTVQFGLNYGTTVTNVSATSVTVRTPAGFGTVDVKITTAVGSVTVKNGFTYKSNTVSTVNTVTPTSGPAAGYNTVTLTGTNLRGTTAVSFGTTPAVSFTINSDNQITAVVPAGLANSNVLVTATNASGLQTTVATYKYSSTVCAPKTYRTTTFKYRSYALTAAQKTAIRAAANELIALGCDQVNLVKYKGSTKGASASYKAYITLSNKRSDAVYNVFVKQLNYKGKSIKVNTIKRTTQISQSKKAVYDSYASYRKVLLTVTRTDAIAGIYPSAGSVSGGQPVTITGTGFGAVAATGAIKFGSVSSPSYVINAAGDTIIATVPAGTLGTSTVSIQYGVAGTTGAKLVYGTYTFVNAPTATLLTPISGPTAGGNTITIVGTGFAGVQGVNSVQFGGVNALSYTVTPTSITAVAPANTAGTKNITITGATGNTTSISYDYVAAPTITTISPANGPRAGANTVTITGIGLTGAASSSILFGATPGTNAVVNASGTSLTITAPARTVNGKVNISITSSGGNVVLTDGYTYGFAVTAISPTTGPTAAGQAVSITGVDFPTSVYAVTFGAPTGTILSSPELATSVVRVSATSITAVAPAHLAGTTSIRVYSDASTYVELLAAYTFAPTITSVTPSSGPLAGNTTITIVGTGFGLISTSPTRSVTVGDAVCGTVTVTVNDTTITCVTPARTAGAKDVVVTINGVSATKTGGFTYLPVPTITSLSATTGATAGGETITITGSGFVQGATTVTVGGTSRTVTWVSATEITITTAAHASGAVDVVVTTAGGNSAATTFTYN